MGAAAPGPHEAVRGPVVVVATRLLVVLVGLLVGAVGMSMAVSMVVVGVVLTGGQVVQAHTGLDFTLPTDGAVVGEPVREITVAFDDPVTLIGPGFEVLDPQGNILTPFVATDDDVVFRLQIDPPMGGGDAAVRYEVRAEDGHTISGGFSFTVLADAPITTAAPTTTPTTTPTTAAPTTPAPSTTAATTPDPDPVATSTPATEPVATVPASTAATAPADDVDDDEGSSSGPYLAIAVVVAVIVGAFIAFRARTTST